MNKKLKFSVDILVEQEEQKVYLVLRKERRHRRRLTDVDVVKDVSKWSIL